MLFFVLPPQDRREGNGRKEYHRPPVLKPSLGKPTPAFTAADKVDITE